MAGRKQAILRTLTPLRIWNIFLLKSSYFLSAWLKKPVHWGKPMSISIEPTTACNLRCPQCPSGLRQFSRPQGNLNIELNRQILDNVGRQLQYINYYFQGEPFIHPQFLNLVKEARNRNIYVATSTNAHFITQEKAREIVKSQLSEAIISIDGTTQETYESYRIEGQLEKVIEGARQLVAAKKELKSAYPIVTFQFLVTRKNEHQLNELFKLADEIGVDEVRLKTLQVYNFEDGNELIPESDKYSRYRKNSDGMFELKNKFRNRCWRMWSSCVLSWDGKVVPCCFDKDAEHQMGELSAESFNTIWKSAIYKEFRKKILQDRKQIEICKNCSEGSKIWI